MSAVRVQEIELLLLDRLCSRPSYKKLVHKPVRKIGARRYSVISDAEDKSIANENHPLYSQLRFHISIC